jgi:hypothetical protein
MRHLKAEMKESRGGPGQVQRSVGLQLLGIIMANGMR